MLLLTRVVRPYPKKREFLEASIASLVPGIGKTMLVFSEFQLDYKSAYRIGCDYVTPPFQLATPPLLSPYYFKDIHCGFHRENSDTSLRAFLNGSLQKN